MKKIALLLLSAAALNSTLAFSQEKTRAEVYQELVASENTTQDDPGCYTKSSYPGMTLACQMRADEEAQKGGASALASTSMNSPQQN